MLLAIVTTNAVIIIMGGLEVIERGLTAIEGVYIATGSGFFSGLGVGSLLELVSGLGGVVGSFCLFSF